MRLNRVLRYTVLYGIAVGLGATVASSCIQPTYGAIAFRCDPRLNNGCPETHFCCSDDPTAEDGALPDYDDRDISGADTPIFSGNNNSLSAVGICLDVQELMNTQVLVDGDFLLREEGALGCLVPCNPTWTNSEIDEVCGSSAKCCQTVAMEPNDCVRDNATGVRRPVTGADVYAEGAGVTPSTDWRPSAHSTHQDPSGTSCSTFVGGSSSTPPRSCVSLLTVANQRGFCMPSGFECGDFDDQACDAASDDDDDDE